MSAEAQSLIDAANSDSADTPQDYTNLDAYSRSLLSPEELAALDEPGEDDAEAVDAHAAEDADDAATIDAPAENAETAKADDKPVAVEPKAFVPEYQAALPENLKEQLDEIFAAQAALRSKRNAGEIDIEEFDQQSEELFSKREDLRSSRIKAEISHEMAQQSASQRWESAQKSFFERASTELGFGDYRKQGNEARVAELDTFIKALAADKGNEDKPIEWFLDEAHRRTKVLNGLEPYPQKAKKPTVAEAVAARKPDMKAVPKTLAQVPGSDGPGDVGDEFADLDSLDGPSMEAAILRMSETQRERFLRGGR